MPSKEIARRQQYRWLLANLGNPPYISDIARELDTTSHVQGLIGAPGTGKTFSLTVDGRFAFRDLARIDIEHVLNDPATYIAIDSLDCLRQDQLRETVARLPKTKYWAVALPSNIINGDSLLDDIDRIIRMEASPELLNKILARCDPTHLIKETCRSKLVELCGGNIRQLLQMAYHATEEAYLRGFEATTPECSQKALEAIAYVMMFGLHDNVRTYLSRIQEEGPIMYEYIGDEERYLITRRVLVYNEKGYVVNPLINRMIFGC